MRILGYLIDKWIVKPKNKMRKSLDLDVNINNWLIRVSVVIIKNIFSDFDQCNLN